MFYMREVMHMVTWVELFALLALIVDIVMLVVCIYHNNQKKK